MFRGNSLHTIDEKGRIIIPTRFREVIRTGGTDAVMLTRMEKAVVGYTLNGWNKLEERILQLADSSEHMRHLRRYLVGAAAECNCDKQGRVLVPPALRVYAGLEKEIVLVGVINRFEIWSKEKWDQENGQMDIDMGDDQVRQEIAQLRL